MPLEAIKCPSCGGDVELDTAKGSGICLYCGNNFVYRSPEAAANASIHKEEYIPQRADLDATIEKLTEAINNKLGMAQDDKLSDTLRRANAWYSNESYGKALELYKEALEMDPKCTNAWIGRLLCTLPGPDCVSHYKNALRNGNKQDPSDELLLGTLPLDYFKTFYPDKSDSGDYVDFAEIYLREYPDMEESVVEEMRKIIAIETEKNYREIYLNNEGCELVFNKLKGALFVLHRSNEEKAAEMRTIIVDYYIKYLVQAGNDYASSDITENFTRPLMDALRPDFASDYEYMRADVLMDSGNLTYLYSTKSQAYVNILAKALEAVKSNSEASADFFHLITSWQIDCAAYTRRERAKKSSGLISKIAGWVYPVAALLIVCYPMIRGLYDTYFKSMGIGGIIVTVLASAGALIVAGYGFNKAGKSVDCGLIASGICVAGNAAIAIIGYTQIFKIVTHPYFGRLLALAAVALVMFIFNRIVCLCDPTGRVKSKMRKYSKQQPAQT